VDRPWNHAVEEFDVPAAFPAWQKSPWRGWQIFGLKPDLRSAGIPASLLHP